MAATSDQIPGKEFHLAEISCEHEGCVSRIKIYVLADTSVPKNELVKRSVSASNGMTCESGHSANVEIVTLQLKPVDEI